MVAMDSEATLRRKGIVVGLMEFCQRDSNKGEVRRCHRQGDLTCVDKHSHDIESNTNR